MSKVRKTLVPPGRARFFPIHPPGFSPVRAFIVAAVIGLACASVSSAKSLSGENPNHPPEFTPFTPVTIIVDLRLGQTSFEATGTAIDRDVPAQIVSLILDGAPSFIHLESFDGNPASFRLHAENLTGAQYGGYGMIVVATDNHPFPMSATRSYAVFIIPEPTFAGVVALSLLTLRARSR